MSDFSYNQRGADCDEPSHAGWEVIECTDSDCAEDWLVYAVCRDEETARLLCDALNRRQIPGQLEIEVPA